MTKKIIVTGAAGFLGSEVVRSLVGQGYDVLGIDLVPEADIPCRFIGGVDLTSSEACLNAFRSIGDSAPFDGLANVAGGFAWETIKSGSAETWERMFRMNLLTALNTTMAALPLLRENGGSIVNIGAASAQKAAEGMGAYAASKSGVAKLTESLAEEYKAAGVRVNAILPSIIDTPANRADMGTENAHLWVKPSELTQVIAFLLSDAASAVTGACIPVMGRL